MAQGFQFAFNDYAAPERRVSHILATNATAFTKGQAVTITSGRWAAVANGGAIAGFANQTIAAGTDQTLEVILAREGDWFDAPYTGTPAGGFVVGVDVADIAANGLSVLASDVTGGALSVLEINTNKQTCRVKVKKRLFG